jgi:hypothetical protein
MKRTFTITTTSTVTVEIDDASLTPDSVKDFSEAIYPIKGPDALMEHAAMMVVAHGEHFIEGIGPAKSSLSFVLSGKPPSFENSPVLFNIDHVDSVCERDASAESQEAA